MNIVGGLAVACATAFLLDSIAIQGIRYSGEYGRPYIYFVVAKDTEEQIQEEIYDGERELLAQLVQAEAGNQSLEGKRLVVDVVLNRVKDPDFPDTITEVIYQANQFSVMTDGAFERAAWTVDESDFEAVRLETEGEQLNTKVLYFSRGKSEYGTNWFKVGAHWFGEKK